jgi:serine/threonine protein kinase
MSDPLSPHTLTASEEPAAPQPCREANDLVATLAAEMAERWQAGDAALAEEFLARHPELSDDPEAAIQLIYEEICLRQEYGQEASAAQVLCRFPQWRAPLEVLLECHRLLQKESTAPELPAAGEMLGDCRLVAELGRGARGCVFLATQPALGDRPVLLKITPRTGHEHLSLARLQHTHIVPLYAVHDHPERNLRALCMPYFGGTTLARLIEGLQPNPLSQRTGQHLLDLLDQVQAKVSIPLPARGEAREMLGRASYAQAICWIGSCLADALHYAHERGLIHLDIKPSNVLIAADGTPMLLDFHLAREPIRPEGPLPEWLGGTPLYLSHEQQAALTAVHERRPVLLPVDGRADIYSLGVLVYEALGGNVPVLAGISPPLAKINSQVSTGLSDLVQKCLAYDAADRYQDAAALEADLRRHLDDQPLRGVRNRSWLERYGKWHRRRPYSLPLAMMVLAVLIAVLALVRRYQNEATDKQRRANEALWLGKEHLKNQRYEQAVSTLRRGRQLAQEVAGGSELLHELREQLSSAETARDLARRTAQRSLAAEQLHNLVDLLRFQNGAWFTEAATQAKVLKQCRTWWDRRMELLHDGDAPLPSACAARLLPDLQDLGLIWADLRVQLAGNNELAAAHQEALQILAQAEELFGASRVLELERQRSAETLGLDELARVAGQRADLRAPRTAWEHYALGCSLMRAQTPPVPLLGGSPGSLLGQSLYRLGKLSLAVAEFEKALDQEPQRFWPNFYRGMCAYRLDRFEDAVASFSVCIALTASTEGARHTTDQQARCYYNRALAHRALGHTEPARQDYEKARALDPTLPPLISGVRPIRSK